MPVTKKSDQGFRTVRIHMSTYDATQTLLATIAQNGWVSVNAEREDKPTLTAVIDEAVAALLRKAVPRGRA